MPLVQNAKENLERMSKLSLFERLNLTGDTWVQKIPQGWIYTIISYCGQSSVFVQSDFSELENF